MKRTLLLLTLTIAITLLLCSCATGTSVPTGMKLAGGSEDAGYYLYVPEEWTVSSVGNISRAHISTLDTTSVSIVEIDTPTDDELNPDAALVEYFKNDIVNFPYDINMLTDGEMMSIGNVDLAYKFVFEFTYKEIKYKEMQILLTYGGRSFIFTYQSSGELVDDESTYFDYHYDQVKTIIEKIKFTGAPKLENNDVIEGDKQLVSDKALCGFELYVPTSWKCEFSGGMVSVRVGAGANISLTKATGTGVSVKDYYEKRKADIESFAEDFTEIEANKTEGVKLGNLNTAVSYEYKYTYCGEVYHVYQVLAVDRTSGYVFTYTARESDYEANLPAVTEVIAEVKF